MWNRRRGALGNSGSGATGSVRIAGLVICRQRPQTASGVVFITMEHEHGFITPVLWGTRLRGLPACRKTSTLLLVDGKLEKASEGAVLYVVAERFARLRFDDAEPDVPSMSRDFH